MPSTTGAGTAALGRIEIANTLLSTSGKFLRTVDAEGKRSTRMVTICPGDHPPTGGEAFPPLAVVPEPGEDQGEQQTAIRWPAKARRVYVCGADPANCHPEGDIGWSSLEGRGVEDSDGRIHELDAEQIADAKKSKLPAGVLTVKIVSAAEVGGALTPTGSALFFDPTDGAHDDVFAILARAAANPELVVLGTGNVNRSEKVMKLTG